jgi:hypothetical protein
MTVRIILTVIAVGVSLKIFDSMHDTYRDGTLGQWMLIIPTVIIIRLIWVLKRP